MPLMEGIIPGQPWIVGARAPAPAGARLPGTVTLAWADGPRSWEGVGLAAELTAADGGTLLEAVARSRLDLEEAALGAPAPWFGGFAFDSAARVDGWWEGFPGAWAVVPQLLLASDGTQGELTAFALVGEDGSQAAWARARTQLAEGLRTLRTDPSPASTGPAAVRAQDRAAWDRLVAEALVAFAGGQLRKVVLARALDVVAERPFALEGVMERIRALAGPAVVYRMLGRDGTSLVGASPEHLFVLHDGVLETQALASTAAPEEVERLTGGRKEAREHAAVVESIRGALAPLSQRIEIGAAPEPLALGYVAHLRTPVQARLRPGVRPADVVRALHPTAAVGGTPRAPALDFLRRHERLARGWYAGAIGWMGAEAADLRVALRCALVRGATARLFSGAGAVTGSTAHGEWHETALKARLMLRALGAEG
jgi:salicylate biosynthesis isochorismate synthase/menaquinone-specific isochorismate synthase